MANFDIQTTSIEAVTANAVETLTKVSALNDELKAEYSKLDEATCKKVLAESIQASSNLQIATDEHWVLKEFNSDKVYWYVVSAKWTTKPVGTVRYFKNAGNVVYTPNGSKSIYKLWRITASGLKQIKRVEA